MLPSVRDRHMSGKMVVRVGRLRAHGIELWNRTPLHSLPMRQSQWGAIGILCCIPLVMEIGCPAVCIPPRALCGSGVDLSRALCPKRATVLGSAALVLRCSIVLSDAECLVGVGSKDPSVPLKHFVSRHARCSCTVLASPPIRRRVECHAVPTSRRNATWLILPVVICLSQRLSHACVSMN